MIYKMLSILNRNRRYFSIQTTKRFSSSTTKNLLNLSKRGFFQDIFPDNAESQMKQIFESGPQTVYAGFDPTADSLHIGNLLIIMGLLHVQRGGHQPIAILGGATGLIGDPSGRKTERNKIGNTIIDQNLISIQAQIENVFKNHKELFWKYKKNQLKEIKILNNIEWYKNFNLIDFISNFGRHFRMGSMLSRSSVKERLQSSDGMSFTEFTYQIFQAYDWLHLLQNYNCRFQLGGSDQMGNLNTGHELISRIENKKSVFGLTLPIVTNEEGDKFGKSGGNAIWLDSNKTSSFSLYQFFIRTQDSQVENLLKLFTFLNSNDINNIVEEHKSKPEIRSAQKILAENVTLLVHGEKGLAKAENISNALYKSNVASLAELDYTDIMQTFGGAPISDILPEPGFTILQLAMKAKCFPTETDAYRIISAGGFYVNQTRSQNIAEVITPGIHILKNDLTLLRVGKKNFYVVRWLK